jgi:hypothetical protein
LEIRERALGEEHPAVVLSLNNLAALYDSQGRYAEGATLQALAGDPRKGLGARPPRRRREPRKLRDSPSKDSN